MSYYFLHTRLAKLESLTKPTVGTWGTQEPSCSASGTVDWDRCSGEQMKSILPLLFWNSTHVFLLPLKFSCGSIKGHVLGYSLQLFLWWRKLEWFGCSLLEGCTGKINTKSITQQLKATRLLLHIATWMDHKNIVKEIVI